jgi:hypothetical protein
MPKPKSKRRKKNIKSPFGILDRKVLEDLRGSYDTWALLDAIDAVDQVRYCDDEIRQGIQALHGMATYIINDNHNVSNAGTPGEETIDELAWRLTGQLQECIEHLEKARRAIQPLEYLTGDPDEQHSEWGEEEEAA